MADFYGRTFGLRLIPETRADDWAEFQAGGTIFALHAIPAHIVKEIESASPPTPPEQSRVKFCFEVEDVATERARLTAAGVTFLESPWGYCDGIDPEGNVFQLFAKA